MDLSWSNINGPAQRRFRHVSVLSSFTDRLIGFPLQV